MLRKPEELPGEDLRDLGFGARVVTESKLRLLNKDGTFNVVRRGLHFFRSRSIYQSLIIIPWWQFNTMLILGYLGMNLIFTVAYASAGPEAINGMTGASAGERIMEAFFFSVQTITTVGYGSLHPVSVGANILVALEAFIGLSGFAVAAALMFARLSRPVAKFIYSHCATIGPYKDGSAFMFRVANGGQSQLLDVEARLIMTHFEDVDGIWTRRFNELKLERRKVAFFPLYWTVVHAIDEHSPLWGMTEAHLSASEAEFLVLVTAIDETFSETVHARSSYRYDEVLWNRKFSSIFQESPDGRLAIDVGEIHEMQEVEVTAA